MTTTHTQRVLSIPPQKYDQRDFQTVFRVAARRKVVRKPKIHIEAGLSAANLGTAVLTRRTHTKSRSGCQTCKQRRIKCDEGRPGCAKCRLHGVDCNYSTGDGRAQRTSSATGEASPEDNSRSANTSTSSYAVASPCSLVRSPRMAHPFSEAMPSAITPYLQALHQFQNHTCQTVTPPEGQMIFGRSILAIADQCAYLMHAIQGTAAAHLEHLTPQGQFSVTRRMHSQAAAYHWQEALRGFRQKLATPGKLRGHEVDALLSTCMLVCIHLYFTTGAAEGAKSFIDKPPGSRIESLQWLRLQSGFRIVMQRIGYCISDSVWFESFSKGDPASSGSLSNHEPSNEMIKDLIDLCRLNTKDIAENNPYVSALTDLCALHQIGEPDMREFVCYVAFMGRVGSPFIALLAEGDDAALVILAHWLAMMSKLKLWWIEERAACECQAIIDHLQTRQDARLSRAMAFPIRTIEQVQRKHRSLEI